MGYYEDVLKIKKGFYGDALTNIERYYGAGLAKKKLSPIRK